MSVLILRGAGGGELVNRQTFVTSGTGFGAVATPTYLYDDFSNGLLNSQISSTNASHVGTWDSNGTDEYTTRSNAVSRGVHSRTCYHNFRSSGGLYNASLALNEQFDGYWYFDWWQRISRAPSNSTSAWTRNFKSVRFYETANTQDTMTLTYIGPGQQVQTQFHTFAGANEYVDVPIVEGEWAHFKLRFYVGATYSADICHFSRARVNQTASTIYSGGLRQSADDNDEYPTLFQLGHYWAHDADDPYPTNAGADIYSSSVLVQRTWARVELGNHATYSSASITEPQITTGRTDTEIEYEVNQGSLSSGQVYEYIFNASNTLVRTTARTLA